MSVTGSMARGCVFLAAVLLAGTPLPAPAQQAPTHRAMSTPRPATAGGLPQPLAPADAARLRRIFQLQARGDHLPAAAEVALLEDRRLLGHVLADAWLRPGGPQPSAEALRAWLQAHADHPDAPALAARLAGGAPGPADAPITGPEPAPLPGGRHAALERAARERGRQGDAAGALALIARSRGLPPAAEARARAEAAFGLFQAAQDAEAFGIAAEASAAMPRDPDIAFIAGLAAWGLGRWESALLHFERAARGEGAAPAQRAAAAFWTARAAVKARRPQLHVPWMVQAAQEPRSFHGLVARRALGLSPGFAWTRESLGPAEAAALAETAAGWRALALLQIGQAARAEAELRLLWPEVQGNPLLARALLVVASMANLPGLSLLAAREAETDAEGRPRDYARYPLPALRPAGGFSVDPSLLYAIALQESRFDAGAISPAGARGLLQVMPATASFIANDPELRGEAAWRLHDPELSMALGQRYLLFLARSEITGGDLIRILAAYNAGPGNVQRWQPAQRHRDDPFLFIEAIPYDETRDYVRKVLTYSWIYASRLGLPAPSLDRMAAGRFPEFLSVETLAAMLAPAQPGRGRRARAEHRVAER
jgi:soluble lytic murein transglycosylase-like protein